MLQTQVMTLSTEYVSPVLGALRHSVCPEKTARTVANHCWLIGITLLMTSSRR